jgi:3-phosphoshikimate 1-carboxyvinyltransferase
MLRGFGYAVKSDDGVISLEGGGSLRATDIDVPADISSAAFFLVAASIAPGSDLLLTHVGINPTRIGVLNILKLMGADITLKNQREVGGEPVADIQVRYAPLTGIEIPQDQVPLAIDEFPALFIAAACARGRTVLRGAEELRVKESDRIAAMAEGLTTLGIANEVLEDGIIIEGGTLGGGVIHTYHDHRIAMSFAIAALCAESEISVLDCDHVATSFPGFDSLARGLGLQISTLAD